MSRNTVYAGFLPETSSSEPTMSVSRFCHRLIEFSIGMGSKVAYFSSIVNYFVLFICSIR